MLWGECFDAVKCKEELEVHGLFRPKCSIVVKNSNADSFRDKVGTGCGDTFDEIYQGLFVLAVVPGWEHVFGVDEWCGKNQDEINPGSDESPRTDRFHPGLLSVIDISFERRSLDKVYIT